MTENLIYQIILIVVTTPMLLYLWQKKELRKWRRRFKVPCESFIDGRFEEAIHEARKLLRSRLALIAHVIIGHCYLETGRNEEALTAFQNALRGDPECDEAYLGIGLAKLEQHQIEERIGYISKALSMDSENVLAKYHLAEAYMLSGMKTKAIEQLKEAIALEPNNVVLYEELHRLLVEGGALVEAETILAAIHAMKERSN